MAPVVVFLVGFAAGAACMKYKTQIEGFVFHQLGRAWAWVKRHTFG